MERRNKPKETIAMLQARLKTATEEEKLKIRRAIRLLTNKRRSWEHQ